MENEFDILIRRMEKNLEMRHTYLMFAFTTSIAAIAALFIVEFANITSWICVVPFAVLIPFQARISYSRLSHAKMEAYMLVYYPGKFQFQEKVVNELYGPMGKLIAFISNFELTMLALIVDILFIVLKKSILKSQIFFSEDSLVMVILTVIVAAMATYSYKYMSFVNKFKDEYKKMSTKKKSTKK